MTWHELMTETGLPVSLLLLGLIASAANVVKNWNKR